MTHVATNESPAHDGPKRDRRSPIRDRLWSKADIAEYLGYAESTVNKMVCKPGFPRRVALAGRGHPRWFSEDIRRWARSHQRREG